MDRDRVGVTRGRGFDPRLQLHLSFLTLPCRVFLLYEMLLEEMLLQEMLLSEMYSHKSTQGLVYALIDEYVSNVRLKLSRGFRSRGDENFLRYRLQICLDVISCLARIAHIWIKRCIQSPDTRYRISKYLPLLFLPYAGEKDTTHTLLLAHAHTAARAHAHSSAVGFCGVRRARRNALLWPVESRTGK